MTKPARITVLILGGAALTTAALVFRSMLPEVVRYLRIRRM